MWPRPKVFLNSIQRKIRNNDGNAPLQSVVVILIVASLGLLFHQKYLLDALAVQASEGITAALIATADTHLLDSFATMRDATSGAQLRKADVWREVTDPSRLIPILSAAYPNTSVLGNSIIVHTKDGSELIRFSDIRLYIKNPTGRSRSATYQIRYTLTIPMRYFWKGKSMILRNQIQRSRYMERYD